MPTFARPLLAVFTGQFVSLLLVGTSVTSALLVHSGFEAPMFMSCLNYAFLAIAYGSWYLMHGRDQHGVPWKQDKSTIIKFVLLVLADVEANYLIVKAYQYTSIIRHSPAFPCERDLRCSSSITLLDCFTIPTVVFLSYFHLGSRYTVTHGIGIAFALGGLFILVLVDFSRAEEAGVGNNSIILGDCLTIVAASLYGVSNVLQEELVCRYGWQLVVAVIGVILSRTCSHDLTGMFAKFLGALISSVQVLALEREEIANYSWTGIDVGLIVLFVVCLCSIYTIVPQVLLRTGAAFLNISILTSDFWAVAFGVSVLKERPSSWYYFSFVSTVVGLFIYHARGEPQRSLRGYEDTDVTLQDETECTAAGKGDDDVRMLIHNEEDVN